MLLLGAHLGSFEVMRCRAKQLGVPINAVADYSNAERVNRVARSLAPDVEIRLISLADDSLGAMLAICAAIDRGDETGEVLPDPRTTALSSCGSSPIGCATGPRREGRHW